jgi:TolB-like protein
MITTDLGQFPAFSLVERARIKDVEAELHLQQSGMVDKATAAKIGGLAGASHLLVGSFTVVGGRMRIDARLFTVASGDIVLAEKMEGAQAQFFDLEQKLVKRIIDAVGVRLGKKEKAELKPQTTDFDAFAKYSEGLALFDEKKGPEAVAAMQAAVARDANFALAATKLAEFQAALPSLVPPPPPPRPEAQCKANPLQQPCGTQQQGPPPSPTVMTGDRDRTFGVVVKAGGQEVRCLTPCQLYLPPGKAEVEVLTPVRYTQTVDVPEGPIALEVSGRNRTNVIIGSVLAGVAVGATGATIGLYESNASTSGAYQYWPLTFALATGAFFPAVYYLSRIGFNHARVRSLNAAH